MQEMLDTIPEPERGPSRTHSSGKADGALLGNQDALMKQYPWLSTFWGEGGMGAGSALGDDATPIAKKARASRAMTEGMDDDEVDTILAEVDRYRADVVAALVVAPPIADFKVGVLGGQWTAEIKGVPVDAVQAIARSLDAKAFCDRRKLPKSFRAEISTYTYDHAFALARGWADKMQHFFNLAEAAEDPLRIFEPDEVASYRESAEFAHAAMELKDHKLAMKRVHLIRSLFA